MKIIEIKQLAIPEVRVIKFARFSDHRGYFTETWRNSQFAEIDFMKDVRFVQMNESYSKPGTVRGLHFQWHPYVGKLVRTIRGRMVDLFLDIRKGSPTLGQAAAYDISSNVDSDYGEWIWVPPGFAHGNYFTEATVIEYLCTGQYNPQCEASVSPLATDIDWSLCDPHLYREFASIVGNAEFITDKDKNGLTVSQWLDDSRSDSFIYRQ